jgi:hypothetical protein
MVISGTTEQLYDMVIQLYEASFNDNKDFTIQLEILSNVNTNLLKDFTDLVEEAINKFNINVEFEVIDNAKIL